MDREGRDRVWNLAKDSRLENFERGVMLSTFDDCICLRDNLETLAGYFDRFHKKYSCKNVGASFHMKGQATELRRVLEDPDVRGVAWIQTSVCGDVWEIFDDAEAMTYPYNIDRGEKHWEWNLDEVMLKEQS